MAIIQTIAVLGASLVITTIIYLISLWVDDQMKKPR